MGDKNDGCFPTGRFKGRLISQTPTDYLTWTTTLDNLRSWEREAIDAELIRRVTKNRGPMQLTLSFPDADGVDMELVEWLRQRAQNSAP